MNLETLPWSDIIDEEAAKYAKPFLPDDPVIFEAGACNGGNSEEFKNMWPDSKIYCFEPHPGLYKEAAKRLKNKKDVKIYPFALSDIDCVRKFYMSRKIPGASSLLIDNLKNVVKPDTIHDDSPMCYDDIATTVNCITIDTFCEDNGIPKIDYLWLDTEGAELDIFVGAERMLQRTSVISVEANYQQFRIGMSLFEDVYDYLVERGFKCQYVWQVHKNWQGNAIFVRDK